jgi:hypothetical protein
MYTNPFKNNNTILKSKLVTDVLCEFNEIINDTKKL